MRARFFSLLTRSRAGVWPFADKVTSRGPCGLASIDYFVMEMSRTVTLLRSNFSILFASGRSDTQARQINRTWIPMAIPPTSSASRSTTGFRLGLSIGHIHPVSPLCSLALTSPPRMERCGGTRIVTLRGFRNGRIRSSDLKHGLGESGSTGKFKRKNLVANEIGGPSVRSRMASDLLRSFINFHLRGWLPSSRISQFTLDYERTTTNGLTRRFRGHNDPEVSAWTADAGS